MKKILCATSDLFLKIFSKHSAIIAVLLFLAIGTRFFAFGYPNQIVFDEFHFVQFTERYFDGKYYFDIHPPLAKLIMASTAVLVGHEPNTTFIFNHIGQQYADSAYKAYRAAVSIAGVLLALSLYVFAFQLFKNKLIAFLSGFLAIFDNALITQSRFALMDIFLLLFGITGLIALWAARSQEKKTGTRVLLYIVAGIFLGCCVSVKMTGALFLGVAGIILLADFLTRKGRRLVASGYGLLMASCAIGIYLFWCWIHLALLPNSGTGDAYMTGPFRATLIGNEYYQTNQFRPHTTLKKIIELNEKMFTYNRDLVATHSESSKWYQWPMGVKPVYYWLGPFATPRTPSIYLHGNTVVWFAGIGGIIIALLWVLWASIKEHSVSKERWAVLLLIVGYGANILAYTVIGRIAFLYHYLPSVLFLIVILAWATNKLFSKYPMIIIFFLVIVLWQFLQLATITYGI